MPKIGMEPRRRAALMQAAIAEIGQAGSLDVTVARIARRAGMSPALAHHYYGSKERILLSAMRHVLREYGAGVRAELARAQGPRARLEAIITASFGPEHFHPDVIAAWLNFYVMAQGNPGAARLLRVYRARLRSNLLAGLRPLVGAQAGARAEALAALIDGAYLRAALGDTDGAAAAAMIIEHLPDAG